MEKKKVTKNDIKILKGKLNVEYIEIDGKKLNLTPSNHTNIENHITHTDCESCGSEFEKEYTYDKECKVCKSKKEKIKYEKLPLIEWDGKSALFDFESDDKYFFDISEVIEYCNDNEINPRDLKLVTCTKSSFTPLSLDWITSDYESVHEDWQPSKEFEEKINEFNKWLATQNTYTWFPSNLRVDISNLIINQTPSR